MLTVVAHRDFVEAAVRESLREREGQAPQLLARKAADQLLQRDGAVVRQGERDLHTVWRLSVQGAGFDAIGIRASW